MRKVKAMFLMLCLTLSGAFCHANSVAEQENEKGKDGTPIVIIKNSSHGGTEKGNSIIATLDNNVLTVTFTENLGEVTINVTTAAEAPVEYLTTQTPNGVILYIPLAGDYIITFTLPNGDEYYGEFTITD